MHTTLYSVWMARTGLAESTVGFFLYFARAADIPRPRPDLETRWSTSDAGARGGGGGWVGPRYSKQGTWGGPRPFGVSRERGGGKGGRGVGGLRPGKRGGAFLFLLGLGGPPGGGGGGGETS